MTTDPKDCPHTVGSWNTYNRAPVNAAGPVVQIRQLICRKCDSIMQTELVGHVAHPAELEHLAVITVENIRPGMRVRSVTRSVGGALWMQELTVKDTYRDLDDIHSTIISDGTDEIEVPDEPSPYTALYQVVMG